MALNTRGQRPSRQSGGSRSGRPEAGVDPTNQTGQTPSEIFGISQSYTTGAPGSSGAHTGSGTDVTEYDGQLEESVTGLSGSAITSTGAPGSSGARTRGGGESVRYTDPFGYLNGGGDQASTSGNITGSGDWTTFGEDNGFSGPTLPILQNARPTSTGAGQGRARTMRG
jgi:hypothetical protein